LGLLTTVKPPALRGRHDFVGHKFWARGYFVSTVGINEKVIRAYIENQEKEDKRLDDLFDR
jgi:putative transposase